MGLIGHELDVVFSPVVPNPLSYSQAISFQCHLKFWVSNKNDGQLFLNYCVFKDYCNPSNWITKLEDGVKRHSLLWLFLGYLEFRSFSQFPEITLFMPHSLLAGFLGLWRTNKGCIKWDKLYPKSAIIVYHCFSQLTKILGKFVLFWGL